MPRTRPHGLCMLPGSGLRLGLMCMLSTGRSALSQLVLAQQRPQESSPVKDTHLQEKMKGHGGRDIRGWWVRDVVIVKWTGLVQHPSLIVVQLLSHVRLFETLWTSARQASLFFTSWVCSDSCPLNQWCYLTISSSATFFSFCLQSFPTSGSFLMSFYFGEAKTLQHRKGAQVSGHLWKCDKCLPIPYQPSLSC